jgi:hypothetical protein
MLAFCYKCILGVYLLRSFDYYTYQAATLKHPRITKVQLRKLYSTQTFYVKCSKCKQDIELSVVHVISYHLRDV